MINKKIIIAVTIVCSVMIAGGCTPVSTTENETILEKTTKTNVKIMRLSSSVFENKGPIPSAYTCDGKDISPSLKISDVPKNTETLALIVDDPDAPAGTWVHWTVWNIDPKTSKIKENSVPTGAIEGVTSFGDNGYGGPCPPSGIHRYVFKLHALDIKLELTPHADIKQLEEAMKDHIIEKVEIMATYGRP